MDATASCSTSREVRPAPSGDYVLLATSGDYNQTILGITFSRTQEHCYKFKNIQGYLNEIFQFKNIQEHSGIRANPDCNIVSIT